MDERYIGKICPYCKTEIKATDEIVICSSCEMPHHKDCWIANEGCTTFGCTGTIQGAEEGSNINNEEEEVKSSVGKKYCTRCGTPHNLEDLFCSQCGNPLGSPSTGANSSAYGNTNNSSSYTNSSYNDSYNSSYANGQTAYGYQGYQNPGGTMEEAFIQNNYYYYNGSFSLIRSGQKQFKWNWAAFFFSTYWYFYRKMYKIGGILIGINFICSLLGPAGSLLGIGVSIYAGLMGNKNYMDYVDESIKEIQQLPDNMRQQAMMNKGGTSIGIALGAAAAIFVLFMMINS